MAGGQALESEKRVTVHMMDPNALTVVGLDTSDGKEHPLYDERAFLALDPGMIASIKALGVRENVHVVVEKRGDQKVALVVDGRRRVLHARAANEELAKLGEPLVLVPTTTVKSDESSVLETMVALNEIRLDDPVLSKAEKASRMLARVGDRRVVARAFGVTVQSIDDWTQIHALSAPVKTAIRKGQISPTAALNLAGLPAEEQRTKLEELVAAAPPGKAATVARAKAATTGKSLAPPKRLLRRLLDEKRLSVENLALLRWVLDGEGADKVAGLKKALSQLEA